MKAEYLVFFDPPDNFSPTLEASGCYCFCDNKLLMLKRNPDKPQGNRWGVPAGKLEPGEHPQACVIREVFEETGLILDAAMIEKIGSLFIRLPHKDYIWHMYHFHFHSCPNLTIALNENQEAQWLTINQALELPLVFGGKEALEFCEKFRLQKR